MKTRMSREDLLTNVWAPIKGMLSSPNFIFSEKVVGRREFRDLE